MRFEMLGPLRVLRDDRPMRVGGPREYKILAMLLVNDGLPVPEDRLVAAVWADDPPVTARAQLHNGVAALRAALRPAGNVLAAFPGSANGPAAIVRSGSGFALDRRAAGFDVADFDRLVAEARAATDQARAAGRYQAALALWRGRALDGLTAGRYLRAQAERLEERRLACIEEQLGMELAAGRHAEIIADLATLTDEYPTSERLLATRMLALYRTGRHSDALAVFATARARHADETGLDLGASLMDLHQAILRADATLTGPAVPGGPAAVRVAAADPVPAQPPAQLPAQLPAEVGDFVGRAATLATMDALLAGHESGQRFGPAVLALSGLAGVGKTATALRWAWRVRDRFPDGQLYVNLRGFATEPALTALGTLARFLRALGTPPQSVPTDVDEAAAMYRTLLSARRMLIVLDNARDAAHVRPLLPGGPATVTVVTSRDSLNGLVALDGAAGIGLDLLGPDEAMELLSQLLGAARVGAEPDAAGDLADACGRLPLALRLAAANLTDEPGRPIAGYLAELRAADPLASLAVAGEPRTSVRAAFEVSYARLAPAAQRLFRLTGLIPGPHFTGRTAAALGELPPVLVTRLLAELAAAHMIVRLSSSRFALHDLLRRYAADLADHDGATGVARDRLDAHYLDGLDAAARALYPEKLRLPSGRPAGAVPDRGDALDWLDAERSNLLAAVIEAGRAARPAAWLLADGLRGYFFLRMDTVEWLTAASAAQHAADAAGDLSGQAAAQLSLSDIHRRLGRSELAVEHVRRALDLARAAGWTDAEAVALGNLGNAYAESGRPGDAAAAYRRALLVNECADRHAANSVVYGNLGLACFEMGHLTAAVDHLEHALALNRRIGSAYGEAVVRESLGEVHHALGEPAAAGEHLRHALVVHRELGERGAEAETRRILAELDLDAGRLTDALEQAHAALTLGSQTGEPRVVAGALNTLGHVYQRMGRPVEAGQHHRRALRLARESAARYAEVVALLGLARTQTDAPARDRAEQALQIATASEYRMLAGRAHAGLASAYLSCGDPAEAVRAARRAVSIQRQTGHRLGEARALVLLDAGLRAGGRLDRRRTALRRAVQIFTAIGAAEAGDAARLLAAV